MNWTDDIRNHLLENENSFQNNYANEVMLRLLGGAELELARRIVHQLTVLMPHGAHAAARFALHPCPWLQVSRFTGPGGIFDGGTRVVCYFIEDQFHIGLRCANDVGQNEADRIVSNFANPPANIIQFLNGYQNDWAERAGEHLTLQIPVPVDGQFPNGHPLNENSPFAQILQWIDNEFFANVNQVWYQNYLENRGIAPQEVITPLIRNIEVGGEPGGLTLLPQGRPPPPPPTTTMLKLNTILYGPPGTGKTFSTTALALSLFERNDNELLAHASSCLSEQYLGVPSNETWKNWLEKFNKLVSEGRIEFTTFHQNYAYEDFVEGLRAEATPNGISYSIEQGIFKRIAYRALYAWLTGDTAPMDDHASVVVRVDSWLNGNELDGNELDGQNDAPPYVLIIDEINRGNMARILGELITLLEESKRARRTAEMSLGHQPLAVTLPFTKKPFMVPPNLYVIGTMNTADRSLVGLDLALRRRFNFVELSARPEALQIHIESGNSLFLLADFLSVINRKIEEVYDRDHTIGHAFLTGITDLAGLARAMREKVLPQLREYFHDRPSTLKFVLSPLNAECEFIQFNGAGNSMRIGVVNMQNLSNIDAYLRLIDNV